VVVGIMANVCAAKIVYARFCAPTPGYFLCAFAKGAVIVGHIADTAKPQSGQPHGP
jgi:biotin transporter BioY